jgi:hypothetical protein
MIIVDSIITAIFVIEFVYNFREHPKPRKAFFLRIDTWIDIVTVVIPAIHIFL